MWRDRVVRLPDADQLSAPSVAWGRIRSAPMRLALALLLAVACAHEQPVPRDDPPPKPLQPTKLQLRDTRPDSTGPQLRDALTTRVKGQLRQLGVPVDETSKLVLEIDVVSIDTKWGLGSPRSCVRLTGRVVRDGRAFATVDTPSERCTSDERYSAFKDMKVLAELGDPTSKDRPTPEAQLILEALDPLVNQLAQRCR